MRRQTKTVLTGSAIGNKTIGLGDLDRLMDLEVDEQSPDNAPQALYKSSPWSFSSANFRANNISSIPYGIFTMDSTEDIDEFKVDFPIDLTVPLWDVSMWLNLKGAAYLLKLENDVWTVGLQTLNANSMRIKFLNRDNRTAELGDPYVFVQKVGSRQEIYKPEKIVYFRTFDPFDDVREGVSSGAVASLSSSIIFNLSKWASRFYKNGAVPLTILRSQGQVPDSEIDRLRSMWQRMLSRVNQWMPAILRKGMEVEVIGQVIKDLGMPELSQEQKEQIIAAHDLPIGIADAKLNRADRQQVEYQLWAEHLIPFTKTRIMPVLNEQLFNPLGLRISFFFNQIEAIQREEIAKAEAMSFVIRDVMLPSYEAATVSLDEYRRVLNTILEGASLPGLDDNPVLPVARTETQQEIIEGEMERIESDLPPGIDINAPQLESGQGGLEKKAFGGAMPQDVRSELKRWAEKCRKRDKAAQFNSDIIPAWFQQQVDAAIEAVGHIDAFSFLKASDASQRAIERKMEAATQAVFDEFRDDVAQAIIDKEEPNYNDIADALFIVLVPILASAATDRALRISAETGIQFDPATVAADSLEWARGHATGLVAGLMNTTRRLVRDAQAFFARTPDATIGDVVKQLGRAFGATRSEAIAQTETTRAFAHATNAIQALIAAVGLQMQRIWQTKRDERVCPICGPLDGTPESVWRRQFPDGPPAHVRCRCGEGLSLLGDDFHIRDAIRRGKERVQMFAGMDDERGEATARQQLKEFREEFVNN